MKPILLALAVGVGGLLAACDTTDTYSTYPRSTVYRGSDTYGTSGSSYPSYGYADPCDPRNVPPGARASVLHQDRPGGSDCRAATGTSRYRY